MKILHFSDIHLGRWPLGWSWMFDKRLLGAMTQRFRRRPKQDFCAVERLLKRLDQERPDAVVFTGDFGSMGAPLECQRIQELLGPLAKRYAERFVAVPGNHDVYVPCPAYRQATEQAFLTLNSGNLGLERWWGNIHAMLVNGAVCLPPWRSGGRIASEELAQLEKILRAPRREGERRVLVSHFPVWKADGKSLGWHHRLAQEAILRSWLEDGLADVLLCGHEHAPYVYRQGHFVQVCAGSLTLARRAALVTVVDSNEPDVQWLDI